MTLNSKIIISASEGDEDALTQVLKHFDRYITTMATEEYTDAQGINSRCVNEDIKVSLQSKLVLVFSYKALISLAL